MCIDRSGGLFTPEEEEQELVFRFAVDRINSDTTILPRSTLIPQIERIGNDNSFHADKKGKPTDIARYKHTHESVFCELMFACYFSVHHEKYRIKWRLALVKRVTLSQTTAPAANHSLFTHNTHTHKYVHTFTILAHTYNHGSNRFLLISRSFLANCVCVCVSITELDMLCSAKECLSLFVCLSTADSMSAWDDHV